MGTAGVNSALLCRRPRPCSDFASSLQESVTRHRTQNKESGSPSTWTKWSSRQRLCIWPPFARLNPGVAVKLAATVSLTMARQSVLAVTTSCTGPTMALMSTSESLNGLNPLRRSFFWGDLAASFPAASVDVVDGCGGPAVMVPGNSNGFICCRHHFEGPTRCARLGWCPAIAARQLP